LQEELAVLGEFQHLGVRTAIAANPDIALMIDKDAVIGFGPVIAFARSAPGVEQIAFLVELQDRRRCLTAFAQAVLQLAFCTVEGGRSVHHPDVIVVVDPGADRHAHDPMMGQGLRPKRVHFELRRRIA
jgi:hypothetical protein